MELREDCQAFMEKRLNDWMVQTERFKAGGEIKDAAERLSANLRSRQRTAAPGAAITVGRHGRPAPGRSPCRHALLQKESNVENPELHDGDGHSRIVVGTPGAPVPERVPASP